MSSTLSHPVTRIKGIGAQLAEKLEKLGIRCLQDLVFHLPYRYEDRTRLTAIARARPTQAIVAEGIVVNSRIILGRRRSLECIIRDDTGQLCLRFFHFSAAQKQRLSQGARVRCYGEVRAGPSGLTLFHPEYSILKPDEDIPLDSHFTPIYSTVEGVSQARIRQFVTSAFQHLENTVLESQLSPGVNWLSHLHYLHFPPQEADITALIERTHPFQEALIKEELLAYQVSLLRQRYARSELLSPALDQGKTLVSRFREQLPFTLTDAQERVVTEVQNDLAFTRPMMRLLQGDVGSGKTVVAAIVALQAIGSGYQTALMVPTDILGEQHRQHFEAWFKPLNITVAWLSGKLKVGEKRQQQALIGSGEAQMVIGTHALFQEDIVFKQLGLVIIDEQHRFGVHQRLQLRDKGRDQKSHVDSTSMSPNSEGVVSAYPHQLIMTATPIPRTLAMTAYADMDYSIIDQLPAGRIPIQTVVISQQRREEVINRIKVACDSGRQAYWVCTLIEESEHLTAEAAEEVALRLQQSLPELTIGLVHGRLKSDEKNQVMSGFQTGAIQLLVATTVIEVGVNVPNASLMIIENPERLGLAQLHQLRGRVGRGSQASHCVLLYGDSLSNLAKERLNAMRQTHDGFEIAEVDLKLRGPGEVLGTRQTGDISFKLADLPRDLDLMTELQPLAKQLLNDPSVDVENLIQRWIGKSEQFAQV